MKWAINNPFSKAKKDPTEEPPSDVEAAPGAASSDSGEVPTVEPTHGFKRPTERFTLYQLFYVFIMDGFGSLIISGGINFAIAYGMYAHQDPIRHPNRLFELPNTLAGDAGVTIIVQIIVTWFIELILVNWDLRKGVVSPIGFIKEPKSRLMRWFMFLDRPLDRYKPRGIWHWFFFILSHLGRSVLLSVAFFPFIFGPTVGFLTIHGDYRGDDWYYPQVWTPQIFKLLEGGILGLLSTPVMTLFWMIRCGWAIKNDEQSYGER